MKNNTVKVLSNIFMVISLVFLVISFLLYKEVKPELISYTEYTATIDDLQALLLIFSFVFDFGVMPGLIFYVGYLASFFLFSIICGFASLVLLIISLLMKSTVNVKSIKKTLFTRIGITLFLLLMCIFKEDLFICLLLASPALILCVNGVLSLIIIAAVTMSIAALTIIRDGKPLKDEKPTHLGSKKINYIFLFTWLILGGILISQQLLIGVFLILFSFIIFFIDG